MTIFSSLVGFFSATILYCNVFPICFIEGIGLTPFKKNSEYIISLILLAAMVVLLRNRQRFDAEVFRLMQASILLTICSELAFTFYIHVYGLSNLVGHFFKLLSFYLIYRAILATGLTKPFDFLFRELVQKEEALQDVRDMLEERVRKRTGELALANSRLQQEMAEKEVLYRELEKSEKRFRAIINAAEDVSFVLINLAAAPSPQIIDFSSGAEKLLGYSRNEVIGKDLGKFYSFQDFQRITEAMTLLAQGKKGFEGELNMVRRSGDCFPAYVSFTPIKNTFNGPTALGVSVDITKVKRLEEEIRKWIEVFKLAEWGISVGNAGSGKLEMINPAFARMHGYTVEELSGAPMVDIFAPTTSGHVQEQFGIASIKGHHIFEAENLRKDGSFFPVQVDVTTIRNDEGAVQYQVVNLQDITQRRAAEQQLLRAKEEWERTFDAIGDVALIIDPAFRIIRINQQGRTIFAAEQEDPIGKHCYRLFRNETQPCPGCPAKLAKEDKATHLGEIHHPSLGKTFRVSASPVLNGEGEVTSMVYFATDITKQKNLEKRLGQAQKMEAIGTLAGGIAHDFNNILSPIIGYAEIALEAVAPDSQTAVDIGMILKGGHRAKDLVKQILSFSRQSEQELQPLRIQFVLKEALKLLRASIPANIEIRQDINVGCGSVLADASQVHQVIMNLCTNAYHAVKEKGGIMQVTLQPVDIDAEDIKAQIKLHTGPYVRLEVSDTGHGIPPEILEKIFEPYFTTKAKGEGTGLGLSVVHGIIEKMGGEITVYSEPGKGTTFHVYFPVMGEVQVATNNTKETGTLPGGKERVLVVDDEVPLVQLEERMLVSLGYAVTTFTSSEQCLAAFRARPDDFDLLITDMHMPKITGEVLAEEVLAIRPDMPIMMLTGFSEHISGEKARSFGIRKFIMKPVLKKDLANGIREVLDNNKGDEK